MDAVAPAGAYDGAPYQAGTIWVNTDRAVSFLMPFGGYKGSGLGRENGAEAIEGYLQSKSVWINNSRRGRQPFHDEDRGMNVFNRNEELGLHELLGTKLRAEPQRC